MNDVSDTEAEIDDPFKLDTLVNKLYTEAHAVAYVDAIRTVITQQAKYADDARITRTVEQFCIHVYKWSANKNWYIFRWSITFCIQSKAICNTLRISADMCMKRQIKLLFFFLKIV